MFVRDVNIVGVEAGAGQQIVRKWMVHLLDANFGAGNPAWYRFGRDLTEYKVDMNPDTEMRKNILGNNTFIHNGYEPSGDSDTFYAHIGDPLFDALQGTVDHLKSGDACKTSALEVHTWEETGSGTNIFAATKQDCYVVPTSYGGDTGGYQIPYQVHYVGDKTFGAYNAATHTFTATGETANAKLSALTVGVLPLSPPFNAETTAYVAATTNDTDVITAAAGDGNATVTIKNGATSVTNGEDATWTAGANTLTITVSNGTNPTVTKTYTVTVTKS